MTRWQAIRAVLGLTASVVLAGPALASPITQAPDDFPITELTRTLSVPGAGESAPVPLVPRALRRPAAMEPQREAVFSDLEIHLVPEPGSLLLLGSGVAGLGVLRARRRRSQALRLIRPAHERLAEPLRRR